MIRSPVATDVDSLVKLGYREDLVRIALKNAQGDRDEAVRLLRKQGEPDPADSTWRGEGDDDWINYLVTTSLPKDAESRAMLKSPIYIRVGSYFKKDDGNVFYEVHVTLKDRRSWSIDKSYSEFLRFYSSLPMGTTNLFVNSFPLPNPMSKIFNIQRVDKYEIKRIALEEWTRELVLTEKCMTNNTILTLLYQFIDAANHGGIVSAANTQTKLLKDMNNRFNDHFKFSIDTKSIPVTKFISSHSIQSLSVHLPIKYDIYQAMGIDPPHKAQHFTNDSSDTSYIQLTKDYQRDRLIINGMRILGSQMDITKIIEVCLSAIKIAIEKHGLSLSFLNISYKSLEIMIIDVLRSIARTESAYLSHAVLSNIINVNEPQPLLLIPESQLASPIEIVFTVMERTAVTKSIATKKSININTPDEFPDYAPPPLPRNNSSVSEDVQNHSHSQSDVWNITPVTSKTDIEVTVDEEVPRLANGHDWCVTAEAQAATVFRLADPETLEPKLQLQVSLIIYSIIFMKTSI